MLVAEGLFGLGPLGEFRLQLLVGADEIGRPLPELFLQLVVGPLRGLLGLLNGAKQGTDGGDARQHQDRNEEAGHVAPEQRGIERAWIRRHADEDDRAANCHRQHRHGNHDPGPVRARDAEQSHCHDGSRHLSDEGKRVNGNEL